MKPLLDLDKPVQRRSGEPAEILKRNALGAFPVIALITTLSGTAQHPETFTLRGSFASDSIDNDGDLINVPTTRKVKLWLAVAQNNSILTYTERQPYLSEGWKSVTEFNLEIKVP